MRLAFTIAFAALVAFQVNPALSQDGPTGPLAVVQGPASAEKLESFFRGTWLVTVQGQQRTRQMVVRDVKEEGGGYKLTAFYNWSDATPIAVTATAQSVGGIVALELTTGAGSVIAARSTGDSRLGGTFTLADKATPISLERISTSTKLVRVSNTPAAILTAPKPAADDLEELLYGTWLVTVGNSARTRTMEIRTVQEQSGKFVAEAVYGWTDGNPTPAPMTVAVENGIVSLDLLTSAKSRIAVKSTAADRFVGTFTGPDGKELPVRLVLTGNDVRDVEVSSRFKNLSLIYIGADNCGTCKRWEQTSSGSPSQSKATFLATSEAKTLTFRQINAINYMNTSLDQYWPEDLRWVRTATNAASGTPRFILIADGKVMINTRGGTQIDKLLMPKIREIAAKKG